MERNKVLIKDVLSCNRVLNSIFSENEKYPFDVGYKIFCLKKSFDMIEEYIFQAMENIFGNNLDFDKLSDEQSEAYNKIINTYVDIEYDRFKIQDIINFNSFKLTPNDIESLSIIFEHGSLP